MNTMIIAADPDYVPDSLVAESAERQALPRRVEVPSGVITVRGNGSRIMFTGGRDRDDIKAALHWYKPKKRKEAQGKIVVMKREAAGCEYQELIDMRREMMSAGALAVVVVQAVSDPPVIELPMGDASEPLAIPLLYAQAKTLERDAKDGVEAMIMFDAVSGAQEFVAAALTAYTPAVVQLEADDVKMALIEHEAPYLLPEMHRKIANSLNKSLKEKISLLNGALASLQQAMSNAQDNFALSLEAVDQRLRVSDGRVLFLEHIIQDLQGGRIMHLQELLRKEQEHAKTLEEQLYKPEVQAILQSQKRKARHSSVADMFDGSRLAQPGQKSLPMPLGKAAEILGKTKPGDLAAQADFLVGQAAEMAGSEDADVIRVQGKLRMKENNKWFNQWYNILNWRTMSKVIKEGTMPLQLPDNKSFRASDLRPTLRSPPGLSAASLPAITPRATQERGVHTPNRSALFSPRSDSRQSADSGSTTESYRALEVELQTSIRMNEETVRSFIAEVKELEKENSHWRALVDEHRGAVKLAQQELEEERMAHNRSRDQAAQELCERKQESEKVFAGMRVLISSIVSDLAESCDLLTSEASSIAQVQARAIVANAPSRGGGVRSRGGQSAPHYAAPAPHHAVGPAATRARTTIGGSQESKTGANSEVLVLTDESSARPKSTANASSKAKGEAAAPAATGSLGALFRKWSGAGQSGGNKAKSVDFKEFTAMLTALGLLPGKIKKHKAQEIFRQANRRPSDTADGDMSEMDWDEFQFAIAKVCEFCKIDHESLLEAGS